jgi:hypothetical protein
LDRDDDDGNEQEKEEILTFLRGNNLTEKERKDHIIQELCTESEVVHAVKQLIADRQAKEQTLWSY